MALTEQRPGFVLGRLDLFAGFRLDEKLIYGICVGRIEPDHLTFRRGDREQDDVILILSRGRLAFRTQHADHEERDVLNTDRLPDRVYIPKQVIHYSLPEQSDFGNAVDVLLCKRSPLSYREFANL